MINIIRKERELKFNKEATEKKSDIYNFAKTFKSEGFAIVQEIAQRDVMYHYNDKGQIDSLKVMNSNMPVFKNNKILYTKHRFARMVMKIDMLFRQLDEFPFKIVSDSTYNQDLYSY